MNNLAIKPAPQGMDTIHLEEQIDGLEYALVEMQEDKSRDLADRMDYAAAIGYFDRVLDQCGKLLCKRLRAYFATHRQIDRLTFKDVFRHAAKRDLIDIATAERWLHYRDLRNGDLLHDYDEKFAECFVGLIPDFIKDARSLADLLKEAYDD